jgi:hypothetical protein
LESPAVVYFASGHTISSKLPFERGRWYLCRGFLELPPREQRVDAAGIEVWFDQSELRGVAAWEQLIRRQIRDCALFVPIISAHTQIRTEGYFRLEWHLADQCKLLMTKNRPFLVPVCIDATAEADAEVPDSFSAVQWTRLPEGQTTTAFVDRILGLLSRKPPPALTANRSSDANAADAAFQIAEVYAVRSEKE